MIKNKLKHSEFAQIFDQTLLRPDACREDFIKLCDDSKRFSFKMVAVNPAAVETCVKLLSGSNVLVGAAIGFPLGQNTIEAKVFETNDAIKKGAGEIDYVINITELKNKNYNYIKEEMNTIVLICREKGITSKVIFENCYLTEDEKIKLCEIALECLPDFIKTSTGFGPSSATEEDVRLMKNVVGNKIKVKASGGIRDLSTVYKMLAAGAERIGTSMGAKIMDEFIKEETNA